MYEGGDMTFADVARRSLALVAAGLATIAYGEDTPQSGIQTTDAGLAEVIVTAQKREQRANDVGMSITALGAGELQDRGVTSVADLAKTFQVAAKGSHISPCDIVRRPGEVICAEGC